jgi:AraC-like DNA-binding protein
VVIAEQPICACRVRSHVSSFEDEGVDGYYGQAGVQISCEIGLSMANIGHGMRNGGRATPIARLDYRPPGPITLDLEIFSASDLRRRVGRGFLQATHQYDFYMLLCVTRGECTHVVDFEPVACRPGSLLAIQPAQVHRFDSDRQWEGWIALFQAHLLPPSNRTEGERGLASALAGLPRPLALHEQELCAVTAAMEQMRQDSRLGAPRERVHALLHHQMCTLLLRLAMLHDRLEVQVHAPRFTSRRFKDFQSLVESRFSQWHGLAAYASRLGCSEKSLTRAAMEGAGVNAKRFVRARINLEAKRLLAHTGLPVAVIAERLGFPDPTHFVKFFKREVCCTPGEFRHRQSVAVRRA